ncbi:MAG: adenosylcobinamide-GDP ribazoletransferase [Pseudomonadota bacterium]
MDRQQSLIEAIDVPAALGFLSRLPIPVDGDKAAARGAGVVWAYPVAGLAIGLILALLATMLNTMLPPAFTAAITLAAGVVITGALHEDGLADTCDGFWGGWTRERRLEIMKDSRIGAYGVIALVLSLLLRWIGLTAVIEAGMIWAIIAIAAASRAAMTPLMALPNARGSGVSATVGRPTRSAITLAVALGAVSLLPLGVSGFALILTVALTAFALSRLAQAKISGQTGDVLGATQQAAEITMLTTLAALLV